MPYMGIFGLEFSKNCCHIPKKVRNIWHTWKTLEWFKSYLRNRKQYIQIDEKNKTDVFK